MSKLIKLNNIHKHYSMSNFIVRALDGVDLTIDEGEFTSIIGPSGSGKSTIMNIIGCLDIVSKGDYYLCGENVARLSDRRLADIRNKRLGFVFQNYNLLNNISALENVMLAGKYAKMKSKECKLLAKEALRKVGLEGRMFHKPSELSGGQQQRVAFARALFGNPLLLLADEPTGNLDSKTSKEILKMLVNLNKQGTTIILVTHDMDIANVATRKIEMLDGKVINDIRREKENEIN
ncbi:ABC transporter ATP-binding protein [Mycoplasmatota bacterium]|nr:ABC transporter ATP-binding protein [Mycoplasmatota bacterium]